MSGKYRSLIFFLLTLLFTPSLAAQEIIPVEQLKPGMRGTSETVYSGDKIESFELEIVDIWRNFLPGRDVIIIRLLSENAVFHGPTSGMSGSPVYFDGKIAGAIAYSFANFVKDPLMGVTPISEMLEIFDHEKARAAELGSVASEAAGGRFLMAALGVEPATWELFTSELPFQQGASAQVQQLPLPLSMAGFTPGSVSLAEKMLAGTGFKPVRGGSSSQDDLGGPLVPGAPVAAVLMSGDMSIAATGTVTWRQGDRVLGFGHPFFGNGAVEIPMARARIMATMSSSLHSEKMSLTGRIVGTLHQDRTTGIMGSIGAVPEMIPVAMEYISEQNDRQDFHFALAREKTLKSFQPLLLRLALLSGLESARLGSGGNTLTVSGFVALENGDTLDLGNLYPGYQPLPVFSFLNSSLHSSGQIAATLAAITNNAFHDVQMKAIELTFRSQPGRRSAKIAKVWADRTRFRPGDSLTVYYSLRPWQGEEMTGSVRVHIPANTTARKVQIVVGGGPSVSKYESRSMAAKYAPVSFAHLMQILKRSYRNDELVVQVRARDRGVVVSGTELPGLPPSLYSVLTSKSNKGNVTATRDRAIFEARVRKPVMVEGVQVVQLTKE